MREEPFTVEGTGIGNPDYAAPKPLGQFPIGPVYTLTDLAELAARLGSIDTFDRRGNVLFMEDFEGGYARWFDSAVPPGLGGAVEWSQDKAKIGSFSLKMTGPNVEDGYTWIMHYEPYPVLSSMGLEVSILPVERIKSMSFQLQLYDGTQVSMGSIRWIKDTSTLQYWGSDLAYHDMTPLYGLPYSNWLFQTLKLVVDFENGKYERFIIGERSYDMRDYDLYTVASGDYRRVAAAIFVESSAAGSALAYLDNVIITQNEPLV